MNIKSFTPLRNFMDLLLDAICVVDAAGRFVRAYAKQVRIGHYSLLIEADLTVPRTVRPE